MVTALWFTYGARCSFVFSQRRALTVMVLQCEHRGRSEVTTEQWNTIRSDLSFAACSLGQTSHTALPVFFFAK
jgi:hypothetical protein